MIAEETYKAVLTHRMNELEKRMAIIEEATRKANTFIESMKDLIVQLPENLEVEYAKTPEPIDPKLLEARSCRDKHSVNERWSEWKKLYLQGWTMARIARRFRCDHTAVCFAKKHNWRGAWSSKPKTKK